MTASLLFVYGSLKRGLSNHHRLERAVFVGEARTAPGYRLIRVGEYPALTLGGSGSIRGEIYAIREEHFADLDEFEGETYIRARIELFDGRIVQAYIAAPRALAGGEPFEGEVWE